MIKQGIVRCSKRITAKATCNLPIPLSQGNQLPISCMSFQTWFMLTQALYLNVFPTEKQVLLSDTLEEQRFFLSL